MTALSPVMLEQHLNCPEKQVELPLRGDSVCSDRYIGRDYLAREYANVWHKIWNIGGVAYQMPEPGDYLTGSRQSLLHLAPRSPHRTDRISSHGRDMKMTECGHHTGA